LLKFKNSLKYSSNYPKFSNIDITNIARLRFVVYVLYEQATVNDFACV